MTRESSLHAEQALLADALLRFGLGVGFGGVVVVPAGEVEAPTNGRYPSADWRYCRKTVSSHGAALAHLSHLPMKRGCVLACPILPDPLPSLHRPS